MKTLYTLMNDRIQKPYDLVVMKYNELKELILKDSGLTLREMQLNFDSATYGEVKELEFNEEELKVMVKEDAIKTIKEKNKKALTERYADLLKIIDNINEELIILNRVGKMGLTPNKASKIKFVEERLAKINLELGGVTNVEDYLAKFWGNEQLLTSRDSEFYVRSLMGIYDLIELTERIEGSTSSYYSWEEFSTLGSQFKKFKSDSSERDRLFESYSVKRVKQAEVGIEVYPFAIEIYKGKHILLDGFNRLFGNDFKNIEKEIIVKVYKDLSEDDYTELIVELNDWKLKSELYGDGTAKMNYKELFLDRGVKAGLFIKYGLTVDSFVLRLMPFSSNMVEALRYSLAIVEESNKFLSILVNQVYQTNMSFTVLELGFYNAKELKNLDAENVIGYFNSKGFKKHIKKIDAYSSHTYVYKYLESSVFPDLKEYVTK